MKPLRIIVAVARSGVIGRNGTIPWSIPEDWRHLLDSVRGGVMIEGRRCYEELGSAFPGAASTIVLTRDQTRRYSDAHVRHSLAAAIDLAQTVEGDTVWVGGGVDIYRESFQMADELWMTSIHADIEGDTKFPDGWQQQFPLERSRRLGRDDSFTYDFIVRARRPS